MSEVKKAILWAAVLIGWALVSRHFGIAERVQDFMFYMLLGLSVATSVRCGSCASPRGEA